jgi:DNA-binding response OmpR family regulator
MVLAIVDDLLLGSKIRASADAAGRTVTFVRGRGDVLAEIRAKQPALVIFDLDGTADPIGAIRAVKAQDDLRGLQIVGFVSHVHTDRIVAAREAGIDVVLARSAFFSSLPTLLASTPDPPAHVS